MREYPKYRKVLFCTDFSENADHAFEYAYGIAQRDEGLLYILHVIPDNPHQAYAAGFVDAETAEKIQRGIQEYLDTNYRERYVSKIAAGVSFEIVTKSGREGEEILEFAKKEQVDLIVMGTHGRTGMEHVFFGSVAEKVLRRSPIPVLIIPSKKKA
ncbi:MAG TPA: universal stress protein [Desulfatiglandales bacterium]|nr:universal stress protein [Desulfatiglandales bacterium]